MRKVDSSLLVCTSDQSMALIALGILPASAFCYEWVSGDPESLKGNYTGDWEFGGEYVGQDKAIPAFTMEELHVLIGGDYAKPDMYGKREWVEKVNMMQWKLYLPSKGKDYTNGAQASAALLEYLLNKKEIRAEDANARMEAYISKVHFNPLTDDLEKKAKNK